jgi:hypothetical protein
MWSLAKGVPAVNGMCPHSGNTGPSRYMVPGVKGDVGEKGVVQGPAEIGEPGATHEAGFHEASLERPPCAGRMGDRTSARSE